MKRIDVIGLNGNDGLHYEKVTTMEIDKVHRLISAIQLGDYKNLHNETAEEISLELAEEVIRLNDNLMGLPGNPKIDDVFDFWEEHHTEDDDVECSSALDKQVGGDHYKTAIQPIQYIHANGISFCEGNVIKYVSRWKNKNGIADLEKAKHYLELLIELEQGKCQK